MGKASCLPQAFVLRRGYRDQEIERRRNLCGEVGGTECQPCSPSSYVATSHCQSETHIACEDMPHPTASQDSQRDLRTTVTFAEILGRDRERYIADRVLGCAYVALVPGILGVPGDGEICFI